ncbi:MAG: hypothetical protein K9I85_04980 [Saprospiraceae bacterium]|nr:hypothetical protein [Saprospiraceae bacterium]
MEDMEPEKRTFQNTSGVGELSCTACGHKERMLSFTHGVSHQLGFQCTSCQQLTVIENGLSIQTPPCSCGGELSREQPIQCPTCKSEDVTFHALYMT